MRTVIASCFTLRIGIAGVLLTGCGGSQLPIGAPGAMPQVQGLAVRPNSKSYKVLHSFRGVPDGAEPAASLFDVGGTLYGTTENGGSPENYCYGLADNSCGTVFSVTPEGTETVLHRFGNHDGVEPAASLIEVKGRLYGTTLYGGAHHRGTIFSITTAGTEKVLHSFDKRGDGVLPAAPLIEVHGTLYGTTWFGGLYSGCGSSRFRCGTVFSVTTDGTEKVLHRFGKGIDGSYPVAGLVNVGGTLYGTTTSGGKDRGGTVFSITPSGKEKVLHSFGKGTDGNDPVAGLIVVNGTLYGTTQGGGTYNGGTVFSITAGGAEKVLHNFGNGTDGAHPAAPLIELRGKLYGTTVSGGTSPTCGTGCGTVFRITTRGAEKVLHSFGYGSDGNAYDCVAGLFFWNGALYGTTTFGGAYGWGTVFEISP